MTVQLRGGAVLAKEKEQQAKHRYTMVRSVNSSQQSKVQMARIPGIGKRNRNASDSGADAGVKNPRQRICVKKEGKDQMMGKGG